MGETKPRSFRLDDETTQKFKEISEKNGFTNQQEAMQQFIRAYEMQSERERLIDSKGELELFERYSSSIQRLFYSSIDAKQNALETAKIEVEKELKSRDMTIADLQQRFTDAVNYSKDAAAAKTALEETIKQLENRIDEYETKLNDAQSIINDKDTLINTLKDAGQSYKTKAVEYDKILEELTKTKQQIANLETAANKNELEHQKQILSMQQQHNNEINAIRTDALNQIAEYQKQYKSMMDSKQPTAAAKKSSKTADTSTDVKPKRNRKTKTDTSAEIENQTTIDELQQNQS